MDTRGFVASIFATVVFVMAWAAVAGDTTTVRDEHRSRALVAQTPEQPAHTRQPAQAIGDEEFAVPSPAHDDCSRAAEACCPAVSVVLPGGVQVAIPADEGAPAALAWALPPDPWLRGIFKPPPLDS